MCLDSGKIRNVFLSICGNQFDVIPQEVTEIISTKFFPSVLSESTYVIFSLSRSSESSIVFCPSC